MRLIGTLLTAAIVVGIPVLFAILAGIKRLKNGFAESDEAFIVSKVRRYTVLHWSCLGVLYILWIIAAITTMGMSAGIILGVILIWGMVFTSAVLLPVSIYGFILTFAMKKTDKKRYLKGAYRASSVLSMIFTFPIVCVAVEALPILLGL